MRNTQYNSETGTGTEERNAHIIMVGVEEPRSGRQEIDECDRPDGRAFGESSRQRRSMTLTGAIVCITSGS